jgi:ubiquinone biosynthesis protein COQ9
MRKAEQDKVLDGFLETIATHGWSAASLAATAEASGVEVSAIAEEFGGRFDLLQAVGARADHLALKNAELAGGSQAIRDRLFDLFMARFDALMPHRAAIRTVSRAVRSDPGLAAFFAVRLPKSIGLLADAAGVDTSGPMGSVRVKALTAQYLRVVRTWLADDSEDMAKTMAALDAALAQAERWAKRDFGSAIKGDETLMDRLKKANPFRRKEAGTEPETAPQA